MARKRRPHPAYTATHEAWSHFLRAGKHDQALHAVHELARKLLFGRGRKEKREAMHRLRALLDCLASHPHPG